MKPMDALGWALVHSIWEGSIAALLVAVALMFLRAARSRYVAACVALSCTLAGFAITFLWLLPLGSSFERTPVSRGLSGGVVDGSLGFASQFSSGAAAPRWIVIVWLCGIALFQLRTVGGWMAVRRLQRTGVCVASETWQKRLNELAARLGILRTVALLESGLAGVPVAIGHFKPVILVPAGLLMSLPAAQVETILVHELAHILRDDYLVNLLQTIAEGLLFYHPAVWWISSVIRAERENCCDDLVVAITGSVHEYAVALTSLAEKGAEAMSMAANRGSIVNRVRRLLNRQEASRGGLGTVLVACGVVAACVVGLAQAQTPAKPGETAYSKWVKEEVAYIISDAERNAYQNLTTDEEREKFIEQFWLRRDPTPGTPENEFKQEYYRRIAYANEHFNTSTGLPGWKTDRGRVYISHGPPDEIEAHQSGIPGKAYPVEEWRYRLIQGVGTNIVIEFDDADNSGMYRMTMDPNVPHEPTHFVK